MILRQIICFVFSFDGVSTFVNNTVAAKSRSGSTFVMFQGVTAGNIAYFGNSTRKFFSMKADPTIALTIGAGVYIWEYWNGAAWTSFNVMATLSDFPYTSSANVVFSVVNDGQIRFDTAIDTDWATTTINSQNAFWVRFRITTAITTSPTMQRIKIGNKSF